MNELIYRNEKRMCVKMTNPNIGEVTDSHRQQYIRASFDRKYMTQIDASQIFDPKNAKKIHYANIIH